MNKSKRVVLVGVPGMNFSDIEKMEKYIKEEYGEDLDFDFISESVVSKDILLDKAKGAEVLISWDQEMDDDIYSKLDIKAYCAASIGYNASNIESATRNNIIVTNVADYCVDEVASHTITLMLSLYRKMNLMVPYVKRGKWDLEVLGSIKRFEDSKVGLLGFGSIPKAVCQKLRGFDVEVLAYDPFLDAETISSFGARKVDLETIFKESDYLSLHTPLTKDTENIVNKESLKLMKNTAYIINTARGQLINQTDLIEALKSGIIQGAGLDVLATEPPSEEERKIIDLDNTIVTAHCAYLSDEASDLQVRTTAKIVADILNNKLPINVRNPEVIENLTWLS